MYKLDTICKHLFSFALIYFIQLDGNCSTLYKMLYKNSLIPVSTQLRNRILTTVCCDDCMYLPKVENAGIIVPTVENESYQLMHNGLKILKDCYYGPWMTTLIQILQGHHEPQEEKAFYEVLKYIPSHAVMIELGSYWGFYSMWFQKEVPGARNFLIEPDPKNLMVGQKNFQLNGMVGHFTQATLGEYDKEAQEFIDWDYNRHIVKQISIDNFATEHTIPFIHILHSDIQGAEVDMLKGCAHLIAEKRIGYFFISTHRGVHETCLQILQDAGLEILVSINRDESFSADGLIVAKLPELPGPKQLDISKRSNQFRMLIDEVTNE